MFEWFLFRCVGGPHVFLFSKYEDLRYCILAKIEVFSAKICHSWDELKIRNTKDLIIVKF